MTVVFRMEELTAAIPIKECTKNVSSHEFKDMLTSWFEEKGILSELRTNLRYKMIHVLKNTTIGRDIIRKAPPSSISLSKQAINLIVAEFLMKNNCDYSLSLFNAEAGLSNTFSDNIINEENRILLQFDKENILNILELIGVHKTSDLCDDIISIYYQSKENDSLLSALITVLSKCILESFDLKCKSEIDLSNEVDFIKKVGTILINLNVPYNIVRHAIENIKRLFDNEVQNIEDNYTKLITKLQNHTILKDKQTKEIQKKKEILELKLIQLTQKQNDLKSQTKHAVKEKLSKEKELVKIKRILKEIKAGKRLENNLKPDCVISHCGERCKQNNELVLRLQSENKELIQINTHYIEEIDDWKNKYQSLLLDFHSLHHKISSLNFKDNQEIFNPSFNIDLMEDTNHLNEIRVDSIEGPDSLTDEVIRDARKRLNLLEEESREIEDKYKNTHIKNKCKML